VEFSFVTEAEVDQAIRTGEPLADWRPKFLCHSFKAPIILSDGTVSSCTLDTNGRNRLGSIYEQDFETIIDGYGTERLLAMADPLRQPTCHACFTRLPRWRKQQVPRSDWLSDDVTAAQKDEYVKLFNRNALSMNIELSSACNLRCTGCAVSNPTFKHSRGAANIDMDRLMEWLDGRVRRISHVRLYHMGETWLHPRWFELCRFLKSQHPKLTLFTSTNGMLLDTEDMIRQVIASGIDHVMFSIHGATQSSVERYMGSAFKIDVALAAAHRLAELRDLNQAPLHLSWKYLLFEWTDSDDEVEAAKRLADQVGFDELIFQITTFPAPSKRYRKNSEAWLRLRESCGAVSALSLANQRASPMTAHYPGRRHRDLRPPVFSEGIVAALPAAGGARPASKLRPTKRRIRTGLQLAIGRLLHRSPAELLAKGERLLQDERVIGATDLLCDCASRDPQSANVQKALGDALSAAGRLDTAISAYGAAIELRPAFDLAYVGLARTLRRSSRFAEAASAYENALRARETLGRRDENADIYFELCEASKAAGNVRGAATAYRLWAEATYLLEPKGHTIYCPIPQNASTFLKTALVLNSPNAGGFRTDGEDVHTFIRRPDSGLRLNDARYLADARYFSFLILRHPFQRLASAYASNFVRPFRLQRYPAPRARAVVREVHLRKGREPDLAASVTFEEFVSHLARTSDVEMSPHWRPQTTFFAEVDAFKCIGCVEDLTASTAEITRRRRWSFRATDAAARNPTCRAKPEPANYHNMSPLALSSLREFPIADQLLTEELRDLVANRYAADINLFRERFGDADGLDSLGNLTGGALAGVSIRRAP
jgi:tetratricopeptide (TPR) repeat protein